MLELIDKAKVLKTLTPRIKTVTPYGEGYNRALEDAAALVALMPTIEPEVRHGRWIVKGQEIYCSECNEESLYNPFGASKFSRFCPNCGARMDLRTPTEVELDIEDSVMIGGAENG